jgi:hypothetical protein
MSSVSSWPVVAGCEQTAVSGCGIDHVLEECLARAIEPVKILEEEDGRLVSAPSARKPARGAHDRTQGAEAGFEALVVGAFEPFAVEELPLP